MGQYHKLVNLDKKEFIHPHQIGNGLKLLEQVGWEYSTSTALVMLLAASNGRGGGDFHSKHPLIGRWAGDRVAFIGDYAEETDLREGNAKDIYAWISEEPPLNGWTNISAQVREMIAAEFNVTYSGDGWMDIKPKEEAAPAA